MNINTYATTTSNDGSSFITKAEFDALINNFNNEMDKYQSGLNAKIDAAISGYLGRLSGSQFINETLGYFKSIPSTVTSVTMQPHDAFPFVKCRPTVRANMALGSWFNSSFPSSFQSTASASLSFTGTSTGKRRMVSEEDGGKYRWGGYVTNYNETFDISWNTIEHNKDTGFDYSTPYLHILGSSAFATDSVYTGSNWTSLKWNVAAQGSGAINTPNSCTVSMSFPTAFTYTGQYDLIYDDYESADQKSDNMRCFVYGNPKNRWFAGSDVTYETVTSSGTKSGVYRVKTGYEAGNYPVNYNISSSSYNTGGSNAYKSLYFFSCGYEPINSWSSIYTKDSNTYTYKTGNSNLNTSKQNYSMIDGAAFIVAEQGAKYSWDVEFTDKSEDVTIWLKYDEFAGAPDSDNCIKVSVDGGPTYGSGTVKQGKGTVTFTAEKNGLIFLKWTEGKSIDIEKSKKITGTRA